MMPLRTQYPLLLLVPALYLVSGSALADVYTWTDAAGHVTYSDTAPPKGARLLGVVREAPPRPYTDAEVREAEMRTMAQRIEMLEREVQYANRMPAPPAPQYASAPYPPPCDWRLSDCDSRWSSRYISPPVAVIGVPFLANRFVGQRFVGSPPGSGFHHGGGGSGGGRHR